MRKVTLYMILAFMVAPIFVSCYQSHKKELGVAYALAETEPDSALAFLNHIEQRKLSEEDMAKYALIYYMAQDKGPLEKVCGYRSTIKILFCPFIKLNNG